MRPRIAFPAPVPRYGTWMSRNPPSRMRSFTEQRLEGPVAIPVRGLPCCFMRCGLRARGVRV